MRASGDKYILRVNLRSDSDLRQFCVVELKCWDAYVFQPPKKKRPKVSYHASGQTHVKVGKSGAMLRRFNAPQHLWRARKIFGRKVSRISRRCFRGQTNPPMTFWKLSSQPYRTLVRLRLHKL